MPRLHLAAAIAGTLLLAAPAASAQQDQGGGWRGTLDQLNRAINPDTGRPDTGRNSGDERYQDQRDRRYEGSSGNGSVRGNRGNSEFGRYSDDDLVDRRERIADEQRQLQRERRALDDELQRRGLSR